MIRAPFDSLFSPHLVHFLSFCIHLRNLRTRYWLNSLTSFKTSSVSQTRVGLCVSLEHRVVLGNDLLKALELYPNTFSDNNYTPETCPYVLAKTSWAKIWLSAQRFNLAGKSKLYVFDTGAEYNITV